MSESAGVHVPANTRAARARPRQISCDKVELLDSHLTKLPKAGVVFANPQARLGNVEMAVPEKNTYRMVADYYTVNNMVAPSAMPTPNLEEIRRGMAQLACSARVRCRKRF